MGEVRKCEWNAECKEPAVKMAPGLFAGVVIAVCEKHGNPNEISLQAK